MARISSTQLFDYPFSVVYDTHLIYSGFFSVDSLPNAVVHLNLVQDSKTLADEICQWYTNDKTPLPLPMQLNGTAFQKKVWEALWSIPKGSTISYGQVALIIGRSLAVRAVGSACSKNPLTLIVPCHRVVGTNSLGGYLWGLSIKEQLLKSEASYELLGRKRASFKRG